MKGFNLGNVWGRVTGVKSKKTDKAQTYLRIQIECANELYGNVQAYGRLWGQEKIDAFLDHYKQHAGAAYRFKGFFSQYDDREGRRLSNFTFYSWNPVEVSEFRASFVLSGKVIQVEARDGEGVIDLEVIRKSQGDYSDNQEIFIIYTLDTRIIEGVQSGHFLQLKGLLRAREPEDYFGMPSGDIKAYAMEIKVKVEDK